ncbi:MAG: hypothetical protein M5U19_18490 [Microthrixaceae bacterium]|nr:hypothetical protein [Microthrixaceae bacterium]
MRTSPAARPTRAAWIPNAQTASGGEHDRQHEGHQAGDRQRRVELRHLRAWRTVQRRDSVRRRCSGGRRHDGAVGHRGVAAGSGRRALSRAFAANQTATAVQQNVTITPSVPGDPCCEAVVVDERGAVPRNVGSSSAWGCSRASRPWSAATFERPSGSELAKRLTPNASTSATTNPAARNPAV